MNPKLPVKRFPLEPNTAQESSAAPTWQPDKVFKTPANDVQPWPFDYRVVIPANWAYNAPLNTTTQWLIGDDSNAPSSLTNGGALNPIRSSKIPTGFRAFVDFIAPYLDSGGIGTGFGQVPYSRPQLPNFINVTWNVFVNGSPAGDYGVIRQILAPWTGNADRPMINLKAGEQLTCSVTYTNYGNALISNVGIRIKGWIIPLNAPSALASAVGR
jgi:hypothetical protein